MTAQRIFLFAGLLWLTASRVATAAPLITAEFSMDTAPVSGPARNERQRPVAAFGAGHYLLAWIDQRQEMGFDIFGVRIKPDGTVLDPTNLKLASLPTPYAGAGALAVWDLFTTPALTSKSTQDTATNPSPDAGIDVALSATGCGCQHSPTPLTWLLWVSALGGALMTRRRQNPGR